MGTMYLERTGENPLEFDGFLMSEAISSESEPTSDSRFHTIRIFSTLYGKLIVEISFKTIWQGESNYSSAEVFESLEEAKEYLQMPEFPYLSSLEDADRHDIEHRYAAAVTRAVGHLDRAWGL